MRGAADVIRAWCDASRGEPIDVGDGVMLSFRARPWDEADLLSYEQDLGFMLPAAFRAFALSVGAGSLFVNQYGLGIEFYDAPQARAASVAVWEGWVDVDDPFTKSLVLIGDARGLGDYFGWSLAVPFPCNFDVFCHEYPPTEYVATSTEVCTWRTFDAWLEQLVRTKGDAL